MAKEGAAGEVGLRKLKVIHVNDSKQELGSHVDRHENIGKGKLGREAFRLLFNDPRFFNIPKILETPKPTLELYAKNMAVLKRLLTPKTKTDTVPPGQIHYSKIMPSTALACDWLSMQIGDNCYTM